MASYRGQDGSVNFGGSQTLQVKSWNVSSTIDVLDAAQMGQAWKNFKPGMGSWRGQLVVIMDPAAGSVQKTIFDTLVVATPAAVSAAIVFFVNGATKNLQGNVITKQIAIQQQLNGLVHATIDFEGDGSLTYAWT